MTRHLFTTPKQAYGMIQDKKLNLLMGLKITQRFTWAEVLQGIRLSEIKEITLKMLQNAKRMADYMERLRTYFGKRITVTSWLRVPSHNARVGGSPRSMHIRGVAVDFVVAGVPFNKAQMARLDTFHKGGLARADFNADGIADFIHVDLGAERTWQY